MGNFSEAYSEARDVIQTEKFAKDWQDFIDVDGKLKLVMGAEYPSAGHGDGLDKLRARFDKVAKKGFFSNFTGNGLDDVIIAACKVGDKDANIGTKAATLKMLKHLYLERKTGNQDVWIYSPPKAYRGWVFQEIKGDDSGSKSKLRQEREVYSARERGVMADALQEAAAWCQKTQINIDAAGGEDMVKAWFMDSSATAQNLTQAVTTLKDGFKKVETVCRSGQLIFSDEPGDRTSGGWKDWAFVYKSETMNVVYLQGAFIKAGNSGNKTMCALTIIHELTHKILGTSDHRYDFKGLKPTATFPFAKAIDNADSWGYFAADICGMLSASDRTKVLS